MNNWTTSKRNIFAGILDLRNALAAGQNAVLIKARNEDCAYPIKISNSITDFRTYEFQVGLLKTKKSIACDEHMPAFLKYLSLNYKNCYGTKAAMDRYYSTGLLSIDNFKGIGKSHLVRIEDLVRFHNTLGGKKNKDYAEMFRSQYIDETTGNETHFFDMYRLKREHSIHTISRFRRKVWVVKLLKPDHKSKIPVIIKILNILMFPLKFIPTKDVLKMDEYKCITYRIGAIINGMSIQFHIPKKFGFK